MITILLNDLRFHAFHGMYEEEKILGNEYVVNACIEFEEKANIITSIHDSINYVNLYTIIKKRMEIPTPLLETVVMQIGMDSYQHYPFIHAVKISLQKMHPPIEGIQGNVGVVWHKTF